MVELLDDFFAEDPAPGRGGNTIDTDEVIDAIAKTVAEVTCQQNDTIRQQIIERLMRVVMTYDVEFRQADASGAIASAARH